METDTKHVKKTSEIALATIRNKYYKNNYEASLMEFHAVFKEDEQKKIFTLPKEEVPKTTLLEF